MGDQSLCAVWCNQWLHIQDANLYRQEHGIKPWCWPLLQSSPGTLEGHEVYTDNYYTSPLVYMVTTTMPVEQHGPTGPNFLNQLLEENGKTKAAWYDRRFVYFLSTFHGEASHGETVWRTNPDGSSSDVPCPPLLPDYQQYMRGIDCSDQHIGYYNVGRVVEKLTSLNVPCTMLISLKDTQIHPYTFLDGSKVTWAFV